MEQHLLEICKSNTIQWLGKSKAQITCQGSHTICMWSNRSSLSSRCRNKCLRCMVCQSHTYNCRIHYPTVYTNWQRRSLQGKKIAMSKRKPSNSIFLVMDTFMKRRMSQFLMTTKILSINFYLKHKEAIVTTTQHRWLQCSVQPGFHLDGSKALRVEKWPNRQTWRKVKT